MATFEEVKLLFAEFPRDAISWRAQSLTKSGDKAMALAYIDARDVMDRLDSVIGADSWQDRYEFSGARTICYLSIKVDGEWVTKADGAGDTDVEAEKGAISDAFKRAAVKWGIGRYLYAMPTPWVPCDTYESNGKLRWKAWKSSPWDFVNMPNAPRPSAAAQKRELSEIDKDLVDCHTIVAVDRCAAHWKDVAIKENWSRDYKQAAAEKFEARRLSVQEAA
ncbi:Rad52/Rad22 family DNA repair protein [Agrobacterium rubi]|uniref:Rad52/Rad22 family DNA repair protein n=1 Tax=Agrobacterium rubi TaxID=28099 RepID=UPI0015740881|nr:Rad52/Rad22 family DNA repair protein [Agrobacterium rubi]NTE87250.1 hypothetical protein [Agrobacterium rubi]NTF03184.1 hypothetical protein [Agrobacterium rubi]